MAVQRLTLYRTKASLGFEISSPRYVNGKLRDGCVFMTIAKAIGEMKYDIENALKVALGSNEVANIIYAYDTDFVDCKDSKLILVHKYNEVTSNITISRSTSAEYAGSYG
jgi:hypothetical protein